MFTLFVFVLKQGSIRKQSCSGKSNPFCSQKTETPRKRLMKAETVEGKEGKSNDK
jgi:hypothetical protein